METPDLSTARWRKSTHSGGNNGACVEIASMGAIRDSKDPKRRTLRVDLLDLIDAIKNNILE